MNGEFVAYVGDEISDLVILEKLPESLGDFLQKTNDLIAFDGGLHIRGIVNSPNWHSLQKVWFGDFSLHTMFSSLKESDIPFGQDCLGDQFVLRDETVWQLSSETDELENLNLSLEDFLTKTEENPVDFLSLEPLLQFMKEGGKIEKGELLSVYPPFCMEESAEGISLRAIPMFDRLGFLADFARQVNGL